MNEKMFVIGMVEVTGKECSYPESNPLKEVCWEDGTFSYVPTKYIMPASRLRYKAPQKWDLFFAAPGGEEVGMLVQCKRDFKDSSAYRFVIVPPSSPKTDWEKWADECPACEPKIKEWLMRMPKKE